MHGEMIETDPIPSCGSVIVLEILDRKQPVNLSAWDRVLIMVEDKNMENGSICVLDLDTNMQHIK